MIFCKRIGAFFLFFICLANHQATASSLQLTDALGREISLEKPVSRIISLAPHITENLYAAGAGNLLVGAVNFSDYPAAAQEIPRVGGYNQLDIEGILALQPDLVIAWHSGNPLPQVEQLQGLGIPVYYSEPRTFADIARNLRDFSQLTVHPEVGEEAARKFEAGIAQLREDFSQRRPVRVFYQVWEAPLMTINHEHLIHQALDACGGENIFAELDNLIPRISREAVLQANPEAIIGGGMGEDTPAWVDNWRVFDELQAVQNNHLYFIPPSLLQRATPRLLQGSQLLCSQLEQVRES
ncbi:cobalamin-binding protein [Marinospirillum perlucidum]|uniref:cobalamin-binding protein n=1 Tax=Marinospirillum perlucidum TaxID=1982602 RepID=UPI000DF4127A|nr:cobalamin-binding protein [Marinospirillum perlucidum]